MARVTSELLCQVAFGKSYRGKQFEGQVLRDVIVEAMRMIDSFSAEDFFPNFFGRTIYLLTGHKARLDKCFHKLDGYLEMVLDEHLNRENTQKNTFLGGVDTSAIVIIWAMSELIRNPQIMQKAQAEIRTKLGAKPTLEPDDLGKLTFLKMIVKETLRLHPPLPLLLPRETRHTCQIHAENNVYDISPQTRVLVNAWAIGRDPNTWNNPNEFLPERFEGNEVDFRGQHFEFVPFGGGRRMCPWYK
ncbi:UNVERIFIED_CONTAM: 4-hydroxyphenylacetaldehyde oxime monooxygenase [Sesamum calycinum]|uniref:4-hydroxyphenylacetaldehyde oxime monooxygenase n=1 Tax=Sesamum calycinum TaxID=2727403 RepID=A0AAW2KXJ7_9LAMI